MIDPPAITTTSALRAAVIRLVIPRADMASVFGPAVAEVMRVARAQGAEVTGPVFAHHLRMDPALFDFELGVPVSRPIERAARVEARDLPARRAVRTVHRGDYATLPEAWAAFDAWIREGRHRTAPDLFETYLAGPAESDDPAAWRTELVRPLSG